MKKLIFIFLLLPFLLSAGEICELTLVVTGFESNDGNLKYSIFENSDGFPMDYEKAMKIGEVEIKNNKAVLNIDLPYGEYAISVFHDENNNMKMDKKFFVMPKEGIGVSNNVRPKMGAPKYEECKFILNKSKQKIKIDLIYL